MSRSKPAEQIDMSFVWLARVGPINQVFEGSNPNGNGQFKGIVLPAEKHCESLLRPALQKFNNGIIAPLLQRTAMLPTVGVTLHCPVRP